MRNGRFQNSIHMMASFKTIPIVFMKRHLPNPDPEHAPDPNKVLNHERQ